MKSNLFSLLTSLLILLSFPALADCENYFGTLDAIYLYELQSGEILEGPSAHFLEGRGRRQASDPRFLEEEPSDGRFYENRDPSSYQDSIDRTPDTQEAIPGYNEPGSETHF